jgi:hypothetical protein
MAEHIPAGADALVMDPKDHMATALKDLIKAISTNRL